MLSGQDFIPEGRPNHYIAPATGHIMVCRAGQTPAELIAEVEAAENAPFVPTEDDLREASFKDEPDRIDLVNRLRTATPAQINNWIDANVTSLAAARAVLKALVKVLAIHIRT